MNRKFTLDANAFIAAWNQHYPYAVFPTLWEKVPRYRDRIVFIKPVFDEIDPIAQHHKKLSVEEKKKHYPLRIWLETCNFEVKALDESTNNKALLLERKYETKEDSRGAGSNDIALVAFAKKNQCVVVTQEGRQPQRPRVKSNYKIPLICSEEGVAHINFVEFLKEIGVLI